MEIKEVITIAIGLISSCAAALAAVYTRKMIIHQRRVSGTTMNWELLFRTNTMLIKNPDLVKFYGIDKEALIKDGISSEELVFIYSNLAAGAALHRISGDRNVKLTNYRRNFLNNEKVQLAWTKYVRGKMLGDGPFGSAIDKYVAKLE